MVDKADMAVRTAKTVAITAGICSSDDEDDFDSRNFVDGFTGKLKKKVAEFVDGIHAGDAMSGDIRVPYVFFPQNYTGEFTDGNYVGRFEVSYIHEGEPDGFQFCIGASLLAGEGESQKSVWSDRSCYTMHVKSFSGERAVLSKSQNAFTIANIGDYSIMTLLKGEAVIDEYGVDKVAGDAKREDVAKSNREFLSDEFGKIADGIRKKVTAWIDDKKVISSLCTDLGDEVNQSERERKDVTE